jgi:hypothetical protein
MAFKLLLLQHYQPGIKKSISYPKASCHPFPVQHWRVKEMHKTSLDRFSSVVARFILFKNFSNRLCMHQISDKIIFTACPFQWTDDAKTCTNVTGQIFKQDFFSGDN